MPTAQSGATVQPGVLVTNITTAMSPYNSAMMDVTVEMTMDRSLADVNALISRLRDMMMPQPGLSMTTSAASVSRGNIIITDDVPPVPLPDEDHNGNGVFDANEELVKMIEKRFDDVDQALRLLVDP